MLVIACWYDGWLCVSHQNIVVCFLGGAQVFSITVWISGNAYEAEKEVWNSNSQVIISHKFVDLVIYIKVN